MIVLHAAQRATFVDWNPTGGIITILQHRCSGPVPMTQQLIIFHFALFLMQALSSP